MSNSKKQINYKDSNFNVQIDKDCDLEAIKHSGVIKEIDDQQYYVSIVAQSACVACHAKSVCNVSDMQDEIVEVPRNKSEKFIVGDQVEVLQPKKLRKKIRATSLRRDNS